jgi:hypothetical protein
MPTHSNTPSDRRSGAAPRSMVNAEMATQDLSCRAVASASAPVRDSVTALPPGRGATVTRLDQAIWLTKLTAPLHPILVHFTIALTATAFAFDLLAFLFGLDALIAIGWWTLAAAVLVTVGTIATGIKSRLRLPVEEGEARSFLRIHMALGPTFSVCLLRWASGAARCGRRDPG